MVEMTARHWLVAVRNRWPTWLALAVSAVTFGGGGSAEGVANLSQILLLLPLVYLVVEKLQRRSATWPLLVASLVLVIGLRALDVIAPADVFVAIALIVLVWAAVDGQLFRSGTFQIQALGMLVFGALGLVGLAVDPDLARYLVAAGWLLHAVWDFVHIKLDKVVSCSFAEWCGVVDILITIELVFKL
jgi:hypothetical protein